MENRESHEHKEFIERLEEFDAESLLNHSRQELIQLARNLSKGKYQRNSRQREKIMQLLVKQLSSAGTAK